MPKEPAIDLHYTGDGRFLVGVPAADLTSDELEAAAERLGKTPAALRKLALTSGLYRETKPSSKEKPAEG